MGLPFLPSRKKVGVTIEEDRIRIVETSQNKGSIQIRRMSSIPLERGLIAGGKIMDEKALELQLSLAGQDLSLGRKKVSLAVPSSFVVIRKLSLPPLPPKEVRSLIEVELESSIHLPFSRPYFDYYKLPQSVASSPSDENEEAAGEGAEDSYVVIAAPGDLIDQYVSLLKWLQLKTESVDIEPLALYRFLERSGVALSENLLIVQFGMHSINVGIFHGEIPEFLRNISLDLDNYRMDVPGRVLSSKELLAFLEQHNAFETFAEDFARELERVINFYQFSLKNGTVRLDTMYLTGDFPDIDRMVGFLRERLPQLQIAPLPVGHIQHATASEAELQAYSVALGLSLRG
ncbi:type IV pilus biogenesis protein PilM [Brevibacillus sp. GCM10020057]|uniref:type IV pilus biogenesis protein PilM n=1 Tax=Brevibacillus sp. GCM10020057 TaxID=3317327 RepID=UPI0036343497